MDLFPYTFEVHLFKERMFLSHLPLLLMVHGFFGTLQWLATRRATSRKYGTRWKTHGTRSVIRLAVATKTPYSHKGFLTFNWHLNLSWQKPNTIFFQGRNSFAQFEASFG